MTADLPQPQLSRVQPSAAGSFFLASSSGAVVAASPSGSDYCSQCHWLHLPFRCPSQGWDGPPSCLRLCKQMAETWDVSPQKPAPDLF